MCQQLAEKIQKKPNACMAPTRYVATALAATRPKVSELHNYTVGKLCQGPSEDGQGGSGGREAPRNPLACGLA